jgi:signal transduction histidine kinase
MGAHPRISVLLVDDEPRNLLALEAVLSDLEVDLVSVQSGEAALRHLLENEVALILLDVRMPGIDGFETARLIRQRDKTQHLPIIFLTAIDRDEIDVFRAYEIGAVDYIFKPVQPEILRSKVRVFIELFRKNDEIRMQAEQIRRSYEELRELTRSNTELEQFAYVASHDLQEPLRTVISYVQLLERRYKGQLDAEAEEFIEHAVQAARRMQRLIRDLLQYSRITTNAREFSIVDLEALAREVVADLGVNIERVNGTVEVGELPTIEAEPTQMAQLLLNLISNALKYHRPGVPPRVRLRGEKLAHGSAAPGTLSGETCELSVEDNGIGFDEKHLDRIFKIFQRLHAQHEYEGTGIGLAICHKIVQRHGGSISARSQPGEGSTFRVLLPVRQPDVP